MLARVLENKSSERSIAGTRDPRVSTTCVGDNCISYSSENENSTTQAAVRNSELIMHMHATHDVPVVITYHPIIFYNTGYEKRVVK
jgi:hypothetical protein